MSAADKQDPFALVPIEVIQDPRLTAMQMRVLITILTFRNRNTDLCNPSREAIARRCGYSQNSISKVTSQLVELGWLTKVGNGGRSRASQYRFHVPDLAEEGEGGHEETVADPETVPDPERVSENGGRSGNGSRSGNETVPDPARGKEQTRNRPESRAAGAHAKNAVDTSVLPNDLSQQVLDDWLSHRKNIKAPATQTVIDRVAKELEIARGSGWTPDNALGEALEAGWRGFKAQWLVNRSGNPTGGGNGPGSGGNGGAAGGDHRRESMGDRAERRYRERYGEGTA